MRRMAFLFVSLGLVACSGEEHQDIRQWMQDSTKDFKGNIPPLPEIKSFPAVAFEAIDAISPFDPVKIEPERKAGSGGIRPDLDRRREPLEAFPLESLRMVGAVMKGKMAHALIQADKNIYQVKIGNYMGQNFGIITDISESEVTLKELVPDSAGEYTERTSTMQLQEKQQEGK